MGVLLIFALFAPLAGALLPVSGRAAMRRCALAAALSTLAAAAILVLQFDPAAAETTSWPDFAWLGAGGAGIDVRFHVGLDGLSLWLFLLTAVLTVTALLAGWEEIEDRAAAFYRLLLILETGLLGLFVARDIVLFYLFLEFTLIPLFFLIGIWGGRRRHRAAVKSFLFALVGSLSTLLGLLAIVLWDYCQRPDGTMTFDIGELTANLAARPIDPTVQIWIFLALLLGFAIKVPLFPLHTWLPPAGSQAPTAVGLILVGVVTKVGLYGLLRFNLPMLPAAAAACMPWLLWLAAVGVVYGVLVALAQNDARRLIAYLSVSQLALCALGIFAIGRLAVCGGALHMINHGLSAAGLLAVVGMLQARYRTRDIDQLGGFARQAPRLASLTLVFLLSSIGLPGLNGFVSQLLVFLGAFQHAWAVQYRVIWILAAAGVVLTAGYMLCISWRMFFGTPRSKQPDVEPAAGDLSVREACALAPLLLLIVWIGLQPKFFLDRMEPDLGRLTEAACKHAAEEQPGDCPNFPAGKMGLSPSKNNPGTVPIFPQGKWDCPPPESSKRTDA